MWYYWLLFMFVAFIAKALLAFVMIYLLLPGDRYCAQCDEETLLIRGDRMARIASAITLGKLQWRWCPRCDWEGLARRPVPQRRPGVPAQRMKPKTTPRT